MGSSGVQGELWGRAADDWASLQEVQHGPFFEAMLDAAGVDEESASSMRDVGGGGASVLAAERGATICGLDAASPLIEIAAGRVPNGDFRVGDLESLPFDDDSFDAVVASNSIQYAQDRIAALQELARVATPEARIAVGLFGAPEKVDFRVIFAAIRDAMPEPPSGDGPFGLSGPGVLQGLVEEAGLNVIDSGEVNVSFVYPNTEARNVVRRTNASLRRYCRRGCPPECGPRGYSTARHRQRRRPPRRQRLPIHNSNRLARK